MAETTKYAPINGGTLISDLKTHFSISRTKRTVAVAYGFVFIFIAFTIFLAFSPSSNSSSPFFTDMFTLSNTTSSPTSSSIFCYFFPNSSSSSSSQAHNSLPTDNAKSQSSNFSQPNSHQESSAMETQTKNEEITHKNEVLKQNQTQREEFHGKDEVLKANQSATAVTNSPEPSNNTVKSSANSASEMKNVTANGEKGIAENGAIKNLTSSLMKKQNSGNNIAEKGKGSDDMIKSLLNCDFFDGNWVKDESYPLYNPGSCSLIDDQFNCFLNGRPDSGYYKLKWKPRSCNLPRLNGSHMLELLRGKRVVFAGDSLNRNMWESLICILRNSVKDQKKVYEVSGRHHFRGEASYSFVFEDYKCTVEFFVSPFLVQEWEVAGKNGTKKETLRLDLISSSADKYKDADIIVFNTGHWWTHEKTSLGKDYYQEGGHVYEELNVIEAFRKAMTTWGRWIDAKVNPMKSLVFFRGYSASHFSGGQWNSGGQCDNETEPITNDAYLAEYPSKMTVLEQVLKGMKTPVTYMNVTRMTDFRKDGHPSIYRKQHSSDLMFQDCSHWCLPGVPDAWNEILYTELLLKLNVNRQSQKRA